MVEGARKSRSMKRVAKRVPGSTFVIEYRRGRPSKPRCPSGRELPGTPRGTMTQISGMTKTQRRPSRPYGGVLSSPAMRELLRTQVHAQFSAPKESAAKAFTPGTVCLKLAGRDAGQLCVVLEQIDGQFVKIDGFTRPRKCSMKHLEPTGKRIDVKKGGDSKAIQAMLKA